MQSCDHTIAKNIWESAQIWTNERKTRKTGTNFIYLSQFDQAFLVSHVFMSFLTHVSAQNFQSEHFDCAKEFASFSQQKGLWYLKSYLNRNKAWLNQFI